jgi:hypothetical protein
VKRYVHARIGAEERARLDELKRVTGETESSLVKRGLRLVHEREVEARQRSALQVAKELRLVGKYQGPPDLSTNERYLDDFGR